MKIETCKEADTVRAHLKWMRAGKEAGFPVTEKQAEWTRDAEKSMFWFDVAFETATRILGREPINQEEAQKTVGNYNRAQNALSR